MRSPARLIQATWLTMMALQTVGSVDARHKLPAPQRYVAISVLWGILFLLADTGYGKLAARLSVLVLLTASVLGPFGSRLVGFLEAISKSFAVSPAASSPTVPGGGAAPPTRPAPVSPSLIPGRQQTI